MWFVYIVRCNDDTLYTGIAKDLEKRISDHNTSSVGAKYTKSRRPVTLVRKKRFKDRATASKEEYRIKRIGKEKKEELIVGRIKK
jgi:putative endonuclease